MRNRKLRLQIAYVGPTHSGKSANLRGLHSQLPSTPLAIVDHDEQGRLPYAFECTTVELSHPIGFGLDIMVYSVPAAGISSKLRRQMIAAADGIVFVADSDSRSLDRNRRVLEGVMDILDAEGSETPVVMQWNKRDVKNAAPVAALDRMLNGRRRRTVMATANRGQGVCWTLRSIVAELLGGHRPAEPWAELPALTRNPRPRPEDIPTHPDVPFRRHGFDVVGVVPRRTVPPVLYAACWTVFAVGLLWVADGLRAAFGLL